MASYGQASSLSWKDLHVKLFRHTASKTAVFDQCLMMLKLFILSLYQKGLFDDILVPRHKKVCFDDTFWSSSTAVSMTVFELFVWIDL